ncbi:nitrogen permease regulator 2 [Amniculicola lignicola CBS 123094]|uniref:Nitrogen permease regulator 2 n=1 Tax=Amniculicola lignicola CBS 123094 TaxID=1392246 RepID=A0A6A5WY64_9PLEO|nr:nitrogen permease regulator 2 [Amniculicola lignicola CBS 123094]
MSTRGIKAIFFTRFHHEKGSRVLHQVPEGSITRSTAPAALRTPIVEVEAIAAYLNPTQQFCDRLLTFCTNHHRVIGYPVCIREGKYSRNEFMFNWALVVEESLADWAAYGEVVRKMGRLLRGLEEQGGFLSREEETRGVWEDESLSGGAYGGGGSKVYALCEMILEDLNNYAECMIPIDDSNTINLKLFPTRSPPPPIHAHHVPLLTISLTSLTAPISSDLTLTRIIPFINGVHSVSKIARLADTDLSLTRKAVQHLVYYGVVILLDIFSFGAIYAPTVEIGGFITDETVQEECARYIRVPRISLGRNIKIGSESERSSTSSDTSAHNRSPSTITATDFADYRTGSIEHVYRDVMTEEDGEKISHETLITLYTSLRQGLTLKNFVLENLTLLENIDIRRFITFGVIKGMLYRIHKYAITTSTFASIAPAPMSTTTTATATIAGNNNDNGIAGVGVGVVEGGKLRLNSIVSSTHDVGLPLMRFLDGMHSFDEICTELRMSEAEVDRKVKGVGDTWVVYR